LRTYTKRKVIPKKDHLNGDGGDEGNEGKGKNVTSRWRILGVGKRKKKKKKQKGPRETSLPRKPTPSKMQN